ncbi:MFS transporter [Pseudonocardia sp. WMMC193]|uniref:MFS transporter n=1 Tax=Pseudonocardia sp. WMMC193 TaxID=2911965 RepID=UPI001F0293BF|nr:MFS transporter [Pseudonocardia sp. WMMC193]MCF7548597.1 MFS transporter [Pseudonocardia sp. WMMC193]
MLIGIGVFYEFFEIFASGVLLSVLRPAWELTTFQAALVPASVFAGMMVGAALLAPLSDRVGRKRVFLLTVSIYLVFALLAALSPNLTVLVLLRFCAGIGAGAMTVLVPIYVGELVPGRVRGRFIGIAMLFGFSAYPIVALLGAPLVQSQFLFEGWRWLLIAAGSGVLLIPVLIRKLPESPRWLESKGRVAEAEAIVADVERRYGVVAEIETAPVPAAAPVAAAAPRRRDLFTGALARRTITMSVLFSLGVVSYYGFATLAPVLLVAKGYTVTQSLLYTALIAVGYPLGAIIALSFAERIERKMLVVFSAVGIAVAGLVFGFATSEIIILISGFVMAIISNIHASAAMMYIGEVFPTAIRATGVAFCYAVGRGAVTALPFAGLALLSAFGAVGVLAGSALLAALVCVTVLTIGPSTNGMSLETATERTG